MLIVDERLKTFAQIPVDECFEGNGGEKFLKLHEDGRCYSLTNKAPFNADPNSPQLLVHLKAELRILE